MKKIFILLTVFISVSMAIFAYEFKDFDTYLKEYPKDQTIALDKYFEQFDYYYSSFDEINQILAVVDLYDLDKRLSDDYFSESDYKYYGEKVIKMSESDRKYEYWKNLDSAKSKYLKKKAKIKK